MANLSREGLLHHIEVEIAVHLKKHNLRGTACMYKTNT